MNISQGNNGSGGAGGGQGDQNERSGFAFATPPGGQPQVQPALSGRSSTSAARVAQLEEQIRIRDEQIAQMMQAMQNAGLIADDTRSRNESREDESQSRLMPREPVNKSNTQIGSTFKTFMVCKPPVFKGGEDSLACIRWLRKMGQTFESAEFTENQKVRYAIRMLEGEALEWWDSVDQILSDATRKAMTWEVFSKKVKDRYCSSGAMHRAEREFLNLQKGSMTIAKYNTTFSEKLQFARVYCPTEEMLVRKYVEGLPFEYRATVRLQSTIEAAMDEARKIEDDLTLRDQATVKAGDKRKWEDESGPSKKPKVQQEIGDGGAKATYCSRCHSSHRGPCSINTTSCQRCGKLGHRREDCKSAEPICYNCRQMGHISRQCPNPKVHLGAGGRKEEGSKT